MQFGRWYPLDDGAAHAPPGRGVFQVRAEALLAYPTGKTAMVHYQLAGDVQAEVRAFAAAHPGRGWLCRHTIEMSATDADDIEAFYLRLVRDFRARFGCEPTPFPP
ncbi:MAG: hypothetical protein K8W52_20655 [Deltaproteobacteria bacterium]|nr:hypothetical protein [Deltaproteobacteria bacterium]